MGVQLTAVLIDLARSLRDAGINPDKVLRVHVSYNPGPPPPPPPVQTVKQPIVKPNPSRNRHKGKSKNDK